jgi:hypothetical protein
MPDGSYGDNPMPDRGGTELEGAPARTFEAMKVTDGPTDEHWQRHLIFIRGARVGTRAGDAAEADKAKGAAARM